MRNKTVASLYTKFKKIEACPLITEQKKIDFLLENKKKLYPTLKSFDRLQERCEAQKKYTKEITSLDETMNRLTDSKIRVLKYESDILFRSDFPTDFEVLSGSKPVYEPDQWINENNSNDSET